MPFASALQYVPGGQGTHGPPLEDTVPCAQRWHSLGCAAPGERVDQPASHRVQEAEPLNGAYWPLGHGMQADPARGENEPAVQFVQALASVLPDVAVDVPAGHEVHIALLLLRARYDPTAHGRQWAEPATDVLPAGQGVQAAAD